MEFIDNEIVPKENYFRLDTCTHVNFHELWHVFKPGDELIDYRQKQTYVVLRVQALVHKLEDPWEQWNKKTASSRGSTSGSDDEDDEDEDDGTPFLLHCAYVDFDGKSFGPVSKKFRIPPFGDLKAITSLPVYPLRFTKSPQDRERLLKRGRMLLDVAKFKAMYYMDATVDTRDEVDSQVVIDFNEALADQDRRKKWEPMIRPINTAAEPRDTDCIFACCEDTIVRSEKVDDALTEQYVKTLLPNNSFEAPSLILLPRSLKETLESAS